MTPVDVEHTIFKDQKLIHTIQPESLSEPSLSRNNYVSDIISLIIHLRN